MTTSTTTTPTTTATVAMRRAGPKIWTTTSRTCWTSSMTLTATLKAGSSGEDRRRPLLRRRADGLRQEFLRRAEDRGVHARRRLRRDERPALAGLVGARLLPRCAFL